MSDQTDLKKFPEMHVHGKPQAKAAPPPFSLQEFLRVEGCGKTTRWRNPLTREVHFDVLVPKPRGLVTGPYQQENDMRRVSVPAGGTVELPVEYDRVVRVVAGGVCIGGEAAMLLPEGYEAVPVDPAILAGFEGDLP